MRHCNKERYETTSFPLGLFITRHIRVGEVRKRLCVVGDGSSTMEMADVNLVKIHKNCQKTFTWYPKFGDMLSSK